MTQPSYARFLTQIVENRIVPLRFYQAPTQCRDLVMQQSSESLSAGTEPMPSPGREPRPQIANELAGKLRPVQVIVKSEERSKPASRWSRAAEILRWRGPWRFLVLALREAIKPLVYWHAYYIIDNEILPPFPVPAARENFKTTVFAGEADLCRAEKALAGMKEFSSAELSMRLKRGDAVAVALEGEQAVGHIWMTFRSGLELAFDTCWVVRPNEGVIYDTLVLPEYRGRGLHPCMDVALNNWAYPRGIRRAFASISAVNNQSLGITRLAGKAKVMTLFLVRIRGISHTWVRATGLPFNSCFQRKSSSVPE